MRPDEEPLTGEQGGGNEWEEPQPTPMSRMSLILEILIVFLFCVPDVALTE